MLDASTGTIILLKATGACRWQENSPICHQATSRVVQRPARDAEVTIYLCCEWSAYQLHICKTTYSFAVFLIINTLFLSMWDICVWRNMWWMTIFMPRKIVIASV